jgi:hypothetical protein
VRAKTRRQTITPDGTPGLLCLSNPGRRQTAIFLFQGRSTFGGHEWRHALAPDMERQERRCHFAPCKELQERLHSFVLKKKRKEQRYRFVPGMGTQEQRCHCVPDKDVHEQQQYRP